MHSCSRYSWLLVVAFACDPTLPGQETPAKTTDPALARIRATLQEAQAAHAQGKHGDARALVRAALAACVALADNDAVHDLLVEVGEAAHRAAELRTEHDAWERVCAYRGRTLSDDDRGLQAARSHLATTDYALGDLAGALTGK